jgi:hypothetical protein
MAIKFRAFDQGQIPTISCLNLATVPLGVDFAKLVVALREYVDRHFAPIWATSCKLTVAAGKAIPKTDWALIFLDDADTAGALGYHDLTPAGLPLSKVFVKTTINDGEKVSVTASHELAEMLVDPSIALGAFGPRQTWYAYETADAVERQTFAVRGIDMSSFVYPAWFEAFHKPRSTRFDHLGSCDRPFQILAGGYMPVYRGGQWTQIFGSAAARRKFRLAAHPRTWRRVTQFTTSRR